MALRLAPRPKQVSPDNPSLSSHAPRPLPRRIEPVHLSMTSQPVLPAPSLWRVGIRVKTFEAWVGVDVYGADNKRVGKIKAVLMSHDGSAQAVVIGVGGFLEIGEKNVAVPFQSVQWRTEGRVLPTESPTPAEGPQFVVERHSARLGGLGCCRHFLAMWSFLNSRHSSQSIALSPWSRTRSPTLLFKSARRRQKMCRLW